MQVKSDCVFGDVVLNALRLGIKMGTLLTYDALYV